MACELQTGNFHRSYLPFSQTERKLSIESCARIRKTIRQDIERRVSSNDSRANELMEIIKGLL